MHFVLLLFWLHPVAYRTLVPLPGMEPVPPALGAESQPQDHQGSPQ